MEDKLIWQQLFEVYFLLDEKIMEGNMRDKSKVFAIVFSTVYPLYIQKVEKKGRLKSEVDEVIYWLTGYDENSFIEQINKGVDLKTFFDEAPQINPNANKITGMICGIRIEDIDDPTIQKIRWLDKLVDEIAKGRTMDKILRK